LIQIISGISFPIVKLFFHTCSVTPTAPAFEGRGLSASAPFSVEGMWRGFASGVAPLSLHPALCSLPPPTRCTSLDAWRAFSLSGQRRSPKSRSVVPHRCPEGSSFLFSARQSFFQKKHEVFFSLRGFARLSERNLYRGLVFLLSGLAPKRAPFPPFSARLCA